MEPHWTLVETLNKGCAKLKNTTKMLKFDISVTSNYTWMKLLWVKLDFKLIMFLRWKTTGKEDMRTSKVNNKKVKQKQDRSSANNRSHCLRAQCRRIYQFYQCELTHLRHIYTTEGDRNSYFHAISCKLK